MSPPVVPRSAAYTLLILATAALGISRLAGTTSQTIRANDRSRWVTVRALVHDGTYAIGHRVVLPGGGYVDRGIIADPNWDTVDKVLDPSTGTFYSSKPPLLPTLAAGVYWVVHMLTGWSLGDEERLVVWVVLGIVNLPLLVLYLVGMARLIDRTGATDWARLYVLLGPASGMIPVMRFA